MRISTIRHNKARGSHDLEKMMELTATLRNLGLDRDDMETRLGISDEEAERMLSAADSAEIVQEVRSPVGVAAVLGVQPTDARFLQVLEKQQEGSGRVQLFEQEVADREAAIKQEVQQRIAASLTPHTVTLEEKEAIRRDVEQKYPPVQRPPQQISRIQFFVSEIERSDFYRLCEQLSMLYVECFIMVFKERHQQLFGA
jgi:hypothetical protein